MQSANSETAILSRLIRPGKNDLARDAARYMLTLEFENSDIERMNHLAERAREGSLSEAEQKEVESYRQVGHLLALLRSKARISLGRQQAG